MPNTMLKSIAKYCEMVSTGEDVDMAILAPYIQSDMKEDWKETRSEWNYFILKTTDQEVFIERVKSATKNEVTQVVINELIKFNGCTNREIFNINSYFLSEFTPRCIMSLVWNCDWDRIHEKLDLNGLRYDLEYEVHLNKVRCFIEDGFLPVATSGIPNRYRRFDDFILNDLLHPRFQEK